jgi:hypothetical protein
MVTMLLCACATQDEAAGQYAARYGISAGQAAADVRTVAESLAAQGLAHGDQAPDRPRRRRRGWWWS